MTTQQLREVRRWWNRYVADFASNGEGLHPLLRIKTRHSLRVAIEARDIARDLGWRASDIRTAEALGLVHDVGRFPQFAGNGAFSDVGSLNHGECGRDILEQSRAVSCLVPDDRQALLDGTRLHNCRSVPPGLAPRSAAFLALIRDADKLDVFRIVLEEMQRDGGSMLLRMVPDVSCDRTCSPQILADVTTTGSCSITDLRTLGDLLVMQLAWFYDVNYVPTFRRLAERSVLDTLMCHVPETASTRQLVSQIRSFMKARIST